MKRLILVAALTMSSATGAQEPTGLHDMLERLAREGRFSGAVVIRGDDGVKFARGYGPADPFTGRTFTPETVVDSGSLAKPVTAAAVLMLARDGKIDLDSPVQRYLPEFPQAETKVRHLLSHSAGLSDEAVSTIIGKTNAELLAEFRKPGVKPLFQPGTGFTYCNFCYSTLALLIERVGRRSYLELVRERVALPLTVTIRPARLADWTGRAIGYSHPSGGQLQRADSYENELFYGTANFSISAADLAKWGSEWWGSRLTPIRNLATTTAIISGNPSGLSWGNWYCAPKGLRCHYLGHHEGFHHMLYWNAERKVSVAMVTNNSLAPSMHQALQRALIAFAEGDRPSALEPELPLREAMAGTFHSADSAQWEVLADGNRRAILHRGLSYPAYAVGGGVRYVPGLDIYFAGEGDGCLRLVSLYEDERACSVSN